MSKVSYFFYGFPYPCGRKLKDYKYTQPLIGMPEPLPETSVLANQKPRKMYTLTDWLAYRKVTYIAR